MALHLLIILLKFNESNIYVPKKVLTFIEKLGH